MSQYTSYFFLIAEENMTRDVLKESWESRHKSTCSESDLDEAERTVYSLVDRSMSNARYYLVEFFTKFPNSGYGLLPFTKDEIHTELAETKYQHNNE